jgi:hypothetical protein
MAEDRKNISKLKTSNIISQVYNIYTDHKIKMIAKIKTHFNFKLAAFLPIIFF